MSETWPAGPSAELAPPGVEARPGRPLSREEVRRVDRRAVEELGVPSIVLMENAGLGLTAVVEAELRARGAGRERPALAIVCGRGNNGGDGLVLARHLELRGYAPRVAYCAALPTDGGGDVGGDGGDGGGDAAVNLRIVRRAGLPLEEAPDGAALAALLARWSDAVLLVDALFGTGLASPLREPGLGLVRTLDADPRAKVAVDIPSGLDCDRGVPLGAAVRAARTVTFVDRKRGFDAPDAAAYTGEVDVVAIGCPRGAWSHVGRR